MQEVQRHAGARELRASISFMSFMASMMQMVCPLVTLSPSFTKGGSPGAGERYIMPAIGDATWPCTVTAICMALVPLTEGLLEGLPSSPLL